MSIYDDLDPVVKELLGEFKQGRVTLMEVSVSPRPPGLATWETYTPVRSTRLYELDATVKAVGLQGREGISLQNGQSVRADDLVITCSDCMWLAEVDGVPVPRVQAALDVRLLSTLQIDGVAGQVMAITNVPSAGKKLVHKYIYRR
jgi:hypothetical protein